MKLLIVEDEKDLSDSIVSFLKDKDYLCEQAFSFNQAKDKICMYKYDCILLDLMLNGSNGLDLLKDIKQDNKEAGIIIVTAKSSLEDKVEGLKYGADDYISKPFFLPELAMRIYALLRRKNFNNDNILSTNDITINLLTKEVKIKDTTVLLTKTEYDLLLFFIENKKRIVSKSAIAEYLSGDMADMMNNYDFVYAHIKNLKQKLSPCADNYIKTYYGLGYKWEEK
jgi:DNA-binding response OmpR family regulator